MNKTVVIVNEWAKFEQTFPEGTVSDFCSYYLRKEKNEAERGKLAGGVLPSKASSLLMKVMSRIVSLYFNYYRAAIAETDMPFTEAYFYLHALFNKGELRKMELINYLLVEYTTGMVAIDKLLKEGLVTERPDENDKRAKLVSLTEKGQTALSACYKYAHKPGEMIFKDLTEADTELCTQLLASIEIKHSELARDFKNKSFGFMYEQVMGGK